MSIPSAERAAEIVLPWGVDGQLPLELPPAWPPANVFWPKVDGVVADYAGALNHAVEVPEGAPRIEDQVGPGAKIAIVVDDPSRWTPVREALPIVLDRLDRAGVRPGDVTISVGVGRHHVVDASAMKERVGAEVVSRHECFSPPVDDLAAYADLGTTPEGVPVRVFRPVASADLRILIGSVLPHLQAGFGGGYKLIFPGTSHRTTLGALHRHGLGHKHGQSSPGSLLGGNAADNPMRRAIHGAAALLGPCFSISHVIGAPGQVLNVLAGHPDPVQDRLAAEARRRFQAPDAKAADLVVAGNHPWPGDPMQSFKVLLQHRASGRPGGVLVGFFWTESDQIDRSFPMPMLRAIAATGVLGGWSIRRLLSGVERAATAFGSPSAFMLQWAKELVVDRTVLVYAPPLFERIGPRLGPIQLFADQPSLWRAAAIALGGNTTPFVRVFPQGGLSFAPERYSSPTTVDGKP